MCKAVLFSKLGGPTSWPFATDLCVELEPLLAAEQGVESLYLDVATDLCIELEPLLAAEEGVESLCLDVATDLCVEL